MASEHTRSTLLDILTSLQPLRPKALACRLKAAKRHDRPAYLALRGALACLTWRAAKQTPVNQIYYVDADNAVLGLWEHPQIKLCTVGQMNVAQAAASLTVPLWTQWTENREWFGVVAEPSLRMNLTAVLFVDEQSQRCELVGGAERLRELVGPVVDMTTRWTGEKNVTALIAKRRAAVVEGVKCALSLAHRLWPSQNDAVMVVEKPVQDKQDKNVAKKHKNKNKDKSKKKSKKSKKSKSHSKSHSNSDSNSTEPLSESAEQPAQVQQADAMPHFEQPPQQTEVRQEAAQSDIPPFPFFMPDFGALLQQQLDQQNANTLPPMPVAEPKRAHTTPMVPADDAVYAQRAQWFCSMTGAGGDPNRATTMTLQPSHNYPMMPMPLPSTVFSLKASTM